MKTIFKYRLLLTDTQGISTFEGWNHLCVQVQRGELCLWAEVDTSRARIAQEIIIFGTGVECWTDEIELYIGTVQDIPTPGFVCHVYLGKKVHKEFCCRYSE